MAERILAARWAPSRSVSKRQLRAACQAAEITPRPNWLHASHEELMAALAEPLLKAGVLVTGRIDTGPTAGGRAIYQSVAHWGVRRLAMDAAPGYIKWDAQQGKFGASMPGPKYAAARSAVEEAVRLAEQNAVIRREDIRDQLALAIMDVAPVAPYCYLPHIGSGLWMVAQDDREFRAARRFLQRAEHTVFDLSELEGPTAGLRAVIERSSEDAQRRYGTRSGWVAIAKVSHDALLEGISR